MAAASIQVGHGQKRSGFTGLHQLFCARKQCQELWNPVFYLVLFVIFLTKRVKLLAGMSPVPRMLEDMGSYR